MSDRQTDGRAIAYTRYSVYSVPEKIAQKSSGRRRSVRTDSYIELVNDLICSQQGKPTEPRQVRVHGSRGRDWNFTFFSCEDCQERFAAHSF